MTLRTGKLLLSLAVASALTLTGCSGDDGAQGPQGAAGAQGAQGEQGPTGQAALMVRMQLVNLPLKW